MCQLLVLGYNLSKYGNGEDLTVAHGGWQSSAHSRYDRFTQNAVLSISANMLGLANAATPFGLKAMDELQRLNPY